MQMTVGLHGAALSRRSSNQERPLQSKHLSDKLNVLWIVLLDYGDVNYSYSHLYETDPHVRGLYNVCVVHILLLLACVVIRDSYAAGRLVLVVSGIRTLSVLASSAGTIIMSILQFIVNLRSNINVAYLYIIIPHIGCILLSA